MRRTTIVSSAALATVLLIGGAGPAFADEVTVAGSGSGADEVPAGAGEAGATVEGDFMIDTDTGVITYTVNASGNAEELTAGHIHEAPAGANGDVVVPLDTAAINSGAEATVTVDPALAAEIAENPADYYLNVHSPSFAPPTGNARAQLHAGEPTSVPAGDGSSAQDQGRLVGFSLLALGAGAVAYGATRRRRSTV